MNNIFAFFAFIFAMFVGVNCYDKYHNLCKEREKVEAQRKINYALDQKSAQMRKKISDLKSDPYVIEQAVRKNLRYVREGEVLYHFEVQPEWY